MAATIATDVLASVITSLKVLGVEAKVDKRAVVRHLGASVSLAVLRCRRGASVQVYDMVFGSDVRIAELAHIHADHPLLVVAPYFGPKTAAVLRRMNIQYVDLAGNVWLTFGDVVLDIRHRPKPATAVKNQAEASGNLFSKSRSKVIFALLAWPYLWDAPQRELAHAAGTSLGQAHNTLVLLRQAGFDAEQAVTAPVDLLDLWAAPYAAGLGKRITVAQYCGDITHIATETSTGSVYVSGAAATPELLRPARLVLYVEKFDPRLAVANKWRHDDAPNIMVRNVFWRQPEQEHKPPSGLTTAPWPLVYADLFASEDPREREAAATWKKNHV